MNSRIRSGGALICAFWVLTLSACDTGGPSPSASTTGSTSISTAFSSSPTPTPSPSPRPTDDRGRAVAAVIAYWAAIDSAAADPTIKLDGLSTVARGQALAQWQTTLADYRAKGWKQAGRSAISAGAADTSAAGFTVTICRDVTDVDVQDKSGNSVVTAGRPDRQSFDYLVVKDQSAFFVTEDRLEGKPCDG